MPCWFFDKSELKNTPSFRNGVDAAAEEKYRREGAKLITDAGSALGLYPIMFKKVKYLCNRKVEIAVCWLWL